MNYCTRLRAVYIVNLRVGFWRLFGGEALGLWTRASWPDG